MTSQTVDYLLELLEPLGQVSARKMFGGYGIYHQGLMIGLVADDTLYLKVDEQIRAAFTAAGSEPFVYHKRGKPYSMSYYRAPESALDETDELCRWARLAYAAAVRTAAGKRR